MKLFDSDLIKTSIFSLLKNKVRSFLTMLGVIIGVFAVVSLVSVGIGIQNFVSDQFESLGSNNIFIAPGKLDFSDDPAKSFTGNKFAEKHLDLIQTYAADYVKVITPSYRLSKTVSYKSINYSGTVVGSNENAQEIFNIEIINGRFLRPSDISAKARVAVIGPLVQKELFGKRDSLGQYVEIENKKYEVVGVFGEKAQDFDDNVFIPYTTAKDNLDVDNFSGFAAKAIDSNNIDETMKQIQMALLRDLDNDEFSVISQEDILSSIQNVLRMLTIGIGAIAGISLVVGGIGIMNIMLVSVTERTREIGLRKALGATPRVIAIQFLTESVLLSVGGGAIGLLLGWLLTIPAQQFIRTEVPWWTALLAFGFSVLVGVCFGTYPALQAGRKDPIEALRYE